MYYTPNGDHLTLRQTQPEVECGVRRVLQALSIGKKN